MYLCLKISLQKRKGRLTKRLKFVEVYDCDVCGRRYERCRNYRKTLSGRTYCGVKCSGKDNTKGSVRRAMLGIEPLARPDVRAAIKKTCEKLYGGPAPSCDPGVRARFEAGCMERYGVKNPSSTPEVRAKVKATVQKKYGVDHIMHVPEINARISVKNRAAASVALEKRIATNLERHGVEYPTQLPEVQDKRKETCMRLYGVDSIMKVPEIKARHDFAAMGRASMAARRASNNPWYSRGEEKLFRELIDVFGVENVGHHVIVNDWEIDIAVMIDGVQTYVQHDGVFWHGLTLSYDEIVDRGYTEIAGTVRKDVRQDEWFSTNSRLLRVTDVFYRDNGIDPILDAIRNFTSIGVVRLGYDDVRSHHVPR